MAMLLKTTRSPCSNKLRKSIQQKMKSLKHIKFILLFGFVLLFSNAYATRSIRHGLIGGSYIYETHFGNYIQGFELLYNRHFSSCVQSNYINSLGFNVLYGNDYQEIGMSYTSPFLRKISVRGHGGLNLIYKINPNYVNGPEKGSVMIKPGIGTTIYSGARTCFFTFQAFVLYNYNIYLQKNQSVTGLSNNSIQVGLFIGFQAFEIGAKKHRKQLKNKDDN